MKCLLRYQWVKLPRTHLPAGKGVMGYWARLAAKAAFRKGQAKYCGHINKIETGTWSGGVVGLKSILGLKSRQKVLDIMDHLALLGYVEYTLDPKTKKLTYKINDFVVKCSGEPCLGQSAVYATDGYGFLCLPRNITKRLADNGYTFMESDAWLDLWCHTVWQDPRNIFSFAAPTIQYGQYGAALTLETLGQRWGWEKTKVWRFLQKHQDAFTLHKLPSSYGCLIFNIQYPAGEEFTVPEQATIKRILDEMRIMDPNTHSNASDNARINRIIANYSQSLSAARISEDVSKLPKNRVAVSQYITRAYFSLSNCRSCINDCEKKDYKFQHATGFQIRGPCQGSLKLLEAKMKESGANYEKTLYDQQEKRLSGQSEAFLTMLTKRGLLEDPEISDARIRQAAKAKKRRSYHNTQLMLRHYRDINWALECFPANVAEELDSPLADLDSLINLIDTELSMENKKLENRLMSVQRSRILLDRFNEALTVLRQKPGNGEVMYQSLYLTYIAPETLSHTEILFRLNISSRHYYRLRQQAINILSIRLWAAPAGELDAWLEVLTLLEAL